MEKREMLTNLYFVRHAHSVYTSDELGRPLSERGMRDAEVVTELLKHERIDIVYSSPYQRAIQTVEGIAKHVGSRIEIEDDFKERKLAATAVDDFLAAVQKVWEDEAFCWEGGESNRLAQQRGVRAVFRILEKHKEKTS